MPAFEAFQLLNNALAQAERLLVSKQGYSPADIGIAEGMLGLMLCHGQGWRLSETMRMAGQKRERNPIVG